MQELSFQIIARIKSDFPSKFGIPRQSGLVNSLEAAIVFEPEFRNKDMLRGIEGFSHLWIVWNFSESPADVWSPTVRPPRLGGNTRLGVFATRSPNRPNPIGLSCVTLLGIEESSQYGTILRVGGADLMDGTPILDIKPYIPYADAHPEASGGFTDSVKDFILKVDFPEDLLSLLPQNKQQTVKDLLSHDPRPSYQTDPDRVYGLSFAGFNIRFSVSDGLLTVKEVSQL